MAELKRVSFKVAMAIKEAGYPQTKECDNDYYYSLCDRFSGLFEGQIQAGWIINKQQIININLADDEYINAPTYLEVWLWLWREKKIHIDVDSDDCYGNGCISYDDNTFDEHNADDPEEAITAAIEHIVDNDLIK